MAITLPFRFVAREGQTTVYKTMAGNWYLTERVPKALKTKNHHICIAVGNKRTKQKTMVISLHIIDA